MSGIEVLGGIAAGLQIIQQVWSLSARINDKPKDTNALAQIATDAHNFFGEFPIVGAYPRLPTISSDTRRHRRTNRCVEIQKKLTTEIVESPKDELLERLLGDLYERRGNYGAVIEVYERAIGDGYVTEGCRLSSGKG